MQHADWSLDTSLALGFGFLLLALVAELARRRRESSLPWGAFALALVGFGAVELLRSLDAIPHAARPALFARDLLLLGGYALSMEFARRALPVRRLRQLPYHIHLLLPAALLLGAALEPRILLGGLWLAKSIAALGCAAAFLSAVKSERVSRLPWLLILGLAMPLGLLVMEFPLFGLLPDPMAGRLPFGLPALRLAAALGIIPLALGLHLSGFVASPPNRERRRHTLRNLGWTVAALALVLAADALIVPTVPSAQSSPLPADVQGPILMARAPGANALQFTLFGLGLLVILGFGAAELHQDRHLRLGRAHRRLLVAHRRDESLLAALPAAFFRTDAAGVLRQANVAFTRTVGLGDTEAVAGRHVRDSELSLESAGEFEARNRQVMDHGKAELGSLERLQLADGSERQLLSSRAPVGDGRGMIGVLMDADDVMERVREERTAREAAEDVNRKRAEALSNLSHEIRTPMNGILGMTELALQTKLDREQREYLESVQLSSEHLLAVINEILGFSRQESGRVDLTPVDFRFADLLQGLEKTFRPQAEGRGLVFAVTAEDGLPHQLHGDVLRLRQILGNLMGNAIKFTREGGVTLRVSELARDEEWIRLRFDVADSGVGIPSEELERIFSPYAHGSCAKDEEGSGLGLCMSRDLAVRLGGQIEVTSQPGRGSRFSLELPLRFRGEQVAPLPEKKPEEAAAPAATGSRGLHVLLVEDNAVNQRLAMRLLEKAGFSATEAWNGEEALSLLRRADRPYDLVLMDLQMPVLDGFATTRIIREEERAGGGHLPIIAMTAHAMQGARERCLAAGLDGYVSKPVRQETLLAEIDSVLRRLVDSALDGAPPVPDNEREPSPVPSDMV